MAHDPLRDERHPYTLEQFVQELKLAADEYAEGRRSHWAKLPHTFDEWFASFRRWMSW